MKFTTLLSSRLSFLPLLLLLEIVQKVKSGEENKTLTWSWEL